MSTTPQVRAWQGARRPIPVSAKPTGLTAEFLKNPLLFMRTHSMSPPNDSGTTWTGDHGTVAATSTVAANQFEASSDEGVRGATVERRTGSGGIRHMQVINHADPNFPGATGLKIAPATGFRQDGSWVPIYFLPWKNLKILSYTIPAVPHSLAEWEDEEYPRFFFTAGINGCSVFVHGDPQGPTVAHAGLESKLSRSAGEFWRMQMAKTKSGFGSSAISGEVNAHDYMFKGGPARKLAEDYLQFLGSGAKDFNLDIVSPFGCVFGIRFGRSWTMYLQKSVVYEKVRFYKKSQVDVKVVNQRTDYRAKDTGLLAKKQSTFVDRKLGPLSFGQKEVQIFSTNQMFAMPLEVVEMYPNRRMIGELKDVFKAG